ncbi:MAG: sugar phosphate isomerase/epimerase family protein [Candidatus Binatia bacterium]
MPGPNDLCLCCGTVRQADFRQLVEAASANGYRAISVWPHLYLNAREQGFSDTDLRTMLRDHGLEVTELDPLCNWIPGYTMPENPTAVTPAFYDTIKRFFTYSEDLFYRMTEVLGGRHLNLVQLFPPAVETAILVDAFGGVCDRAAQHGLLVSLEFLPWCPINNLAAALEIVQGADRPNGGVMFDTWHHFRAGGTSAELRQLSGRTIAAIQFNDATREPTGDLFTETVTARVLPGEGAIDLVGNIQALDAIGNTAPIGVEVFSDTLAALSPTEAARLAVEATRRTLQAARGGVRQV